MKKHIEKLLYLIENDQEFVDHLKRHDDKPSYRPYDFEDIRYLQPIVHTVQIYSDEHMISEIIRILDMPLIGKSREQTVTYFLAYDYTRLEDYAVYYGLSNLNSNDIFLLWERINSLYFNLVFTSILDFYPHILDDN